MTHEKQHKKNNISDTDKILEQLQQADTKTTKTAEVDLEVDSNLKLDKKIAEQEKEINNLKELLLRTQAELRNVQHISHKKIEEAKQFSITPVWKALMPIWDHLEKAANYSCNEPQAAILHEGVNLVLQESHAVFQRFGLEILDPVGQPFDPELHEAVSSVENTAVDSRIVVEVLQKGYRLQGRLLRPARVIIAK